MTTNQANQASLLNIPKWVNNLAIIALQKKTDQAWGGGRQLINTRIQALVTPIMQKGSVF